MRGTGTLVADCGHPANCRLVGESVPGDSGATYRVGGWFKGSGRADCFLTLRFWSDAGGTQFVGEANIPLDGSFTDWTEKPATFAAPGNAVGADIMFRCPANTTVDLYADDFLVNQIN